MFTMSFSIGRQNSKYTTFAYTQHTISIPANSAELSKASPMACLRHLARFIPVQQHRINTSCRNRALNATCLCPTNVLASGSVLQRLVLPRRISDGKRAHSGSVWSLALPAPRATARSPSPQIRPISGPVGCPQKAPSVSLPSRKNSAGYRLPVPPAPSVVGSWPEEKYQQTSLLMLLTIQQEAVLQRARMPC